MDIYISLPTFRVSQTKIILYLNYHPCMMQFLIKSTINFLFIPKFLKLLRQIDFLVILLYFHS